MITVMHVLDALDTAGVDERAVHVYNLSYNMNVDGYLESPGSYNYVVMWNLKGH
jgi:hypothetical protein